MGPTLCLLRLLLLQGCNLGSLEV